MGAGSRIADCPTTFLPGSNDTCAGPPGGFLKRFDGEDYTSDNFIALDAYQHWCCLRFTVPTVSAQFKFLSRKAHLPSPTLVLFARSCHVSGRAARRGESARAFILAAESPTRVSPTRVTTTWPQAEPHIADPLSGLLSADVLNVASVMVTVICCAAIVIYLLEKECARAAPSLFPRNSSPAGGPSS